MLYSGIIRGQTEEFVNKVDSIYSMIKIDSAWHTIQSSYPENTTLQILSSPTKGTRFIFKDSVNTLSDTICIKVVDNSVIGSGVLLLCHGWSRPEKMMSVPPGFNLSYYTSSRLSYMCVQYTSVPSRMSIYFFHLTKYKQNGNKKLKG